MPNLTKSKLVWAAAIAVGLVGLYALIGFKVAPSIARDQAQAFVRENYGRELSIGPIAIHPFKLQAEVRDLALPDADGRPMLGFERLFVDFEIASLWSGALTFREFIVEAPRLRAVVRPDGSLNLADLALPSEEPEEPTPSVWIQRLAVERGAIAFADESRQAPLARSFHDVGFTLEDFRTTPEGGDFSFNARSPQDETFDWKGRFALEPVISSQGEFRVGALHAPGLIDFLGDVRPFTLTQGTIDLDGTYRVSLGEQVELAVELPAIALKGLSLRARDADSDWVRIPSLLVSGVSLALPEQSVAVQKVTLDGLEVEAWMSPGGAINLDQLLAFEPDGDLPPAQAAQPAAPARPWQVTVGDVELANAAIAFEDRTLTPAARFDLQPLNLRVSDVSLDMSRPLPVRLDAVINGHANFAAAGVLTPEPLSADFDVKLAKARMQLLQPYVLPVADLTITSGELLVEGKATVAPPGGKGPEMSFAGHVAVDRFRSVDNALKQEFVSFTRLDLTGLGFALAPDGLTIDRVRVLQPYARVIISPEQVINVAVVLGPDDAAATPQPPAAAASSDAFPVRIGEIRIDGGRLDFTDLFVKPSFSADVQQLNGTITGASSAPDSRAKVALTGRLDEFSPVSIQGELQPFAFDRYTDLGLKFENISLPILNPYSTPLAGYNIAKGKLTTDLHYTIVERRLDAQHRIRIDQLEWGEATATQGEATLPVKFATALLKDKDGVIDLDVPVGGTLDDPTFRIGPIVWQVIKNIIVKAVTAPFSLLGSLFAGAEDAQFVDFAPGEATLDVATAERLDALARSLVEKPELKLDVPIGALAELDQPALAERAWRAAVDGATAARFEKKGKAGEPIPAYADLDTGAKIDVLTDLVKQRTGAAPQVPEAPQPPDGTPRAEAKALRETATVAYLEQSVRESVTVSDSELAALAEERAAAIERALLADGALDAGRVFKVREGKVAPNGGKVRFELGLE